MILINLTAPEDRINQYWYIPDLLFTIAAIFVSYISLSCVEYYYEHSISSYVAKEHDFREKNLTLSAAVKDYDETVMNINAVKNKITAVKSLRFSLADRFLPVMIMEILQRLKPQGVWFTNIEDDSAEGILTIEGGTFSEHLVAQFIGDMNKKSTQKIESSLDLVYFNEVYLDKIYIAGGESKSSGFIAKDDKEQEAFDNVQSKIVKDSFKKTSERHQDSTEIQWFSAEEMKKFPNFVIKVSYATREAI